MYNRSAAIAGFTVGSLGMAALMAGICYLVLMPFGYGYVGAELAAGWYAWQTAYRWEFINAYLAEMLEAYDL